MKYIINALFILFVTIIFTACSTKELENVKWHYVENKISYIKDIKPILDKRCVSCHSCYNAPCQLKLSSYEGLKRGLSKISMYGTRIEATDPTRLFIDAKSTKDWRKKGFTSIVDDDLNKSILMQVLSHKKYYPENIGSYDPESDELTCAKDKTELEKYYDDKPQHAMPYGMPALSEKEYDLLANWIKNKSKNDEKVIINKKEKNIIKTYENFFNQSSIKNKMMSRYIYEHIYLAHLKIEKLNNKFYKIIRSRTNTGSKIDQIATRFVYSDPKIKFYYRLQEIKSTIVHKTHMVYKLSPSKLKRYTKLFLEDKWNSIPYLQSYDIKIAANPFEAFEQIPVKAKYQFLLDNVHYFIMNFIRGPVCRGQIALNVINDHFWVMFLKPEYDLSVKNNFFLYKSLSDLELPNEKGSNPSLYEATDFLSYDKKAKNYLENRDYEYNKFYPNGLGMNSIWKGNKENDSILTIYRHFNSSSIHKGALGDIPKTLWLIDYVLLERIYYSLVAGFDVFGNISHQFLTRKYMDNLRVEGESNFLNYLPKKSRKRIFSSWYEGEFAQKHLSFTQTNIKTKVKYTIKDYKKEFVNKVLDYTNNKRDPINFIKDSDELFYPKTYKNKKDIEKAFKMLSLANSNNFIKTIDNSNTNLSFIRIRLKDKDLVYSIIVNKWHKNVSFMFDEENRLVPSRYRLNFIEGYIGSYPNFFFDIKIEDFAGFVSLIKNYKNNKEDLNKMYTYGVNRSDKRFWKTYDWFVSDFKKKDKVNSGLFDLNRYYHKSLISE